MNEAIATAIKPRPTAGASAPGWYIRRRRPTMLRRNKPPSQCRLRAPPWAVERHGPSRELTQDRRTVGQL